MSEEKPKLLLHVCCAPDATVAVERLAPDYTITIFFYNPNVHPEKEYDLRLNEMERLAKQLNVPLLPAPYNSDDWFKAVKGMEDVPEGGARCEVCFRMRLELAAQMAVEHQFDIFATVLTVSPHKNAKLINQIGIEYSAKYSVDFMEANFKKKDGFKRSIELSRQYNLYRQDYCGCIFSQIEREKMKQEKAQT